MTNFLLLSHYLSQRVNQCLRDACHKYGFPVCMELIDCGHGHGKEMGQNHSWTKNLDAISCFQEGGEFPYGIYHKAVNLTTKPNVITRYVYSLFWGFQVCLAFIVIRFSIILAIKFVLLCISKKL